MLLYAINSATEFFDDVGYNSRRILTHIVGKGGLTGVKELLASIINIGSKNSLGALAVSAPLSAAFSSAIVQGDHLHRRQKILDQYRTEIANWLGNEKKPEELTQQDLYLAAFGDKKRGIKGNESLKEALEKSRKERNWGVGISIITSLASATALWALFSGTTSPLNALNDGSVGGTGLSMLAAGAIGYGIYMPISTALHWASENIFGVERTTVNDRIRAISRSLDHGKTVSQEMVFQAYLEAHPQVEDAIKASYGKDYEFLKEEQRKQILMEVGPKIDLPRLTQAINRKEMRPGELAFTVQGEVSAAPPSKAEVAMMPDEKDESKSTFSYVQHVGGSKNHDGRSHVERYEQSIHAPQETSIPAPR